MDKEHSQLSELIRKLRWRVDMTQSGAVEGTHLDRHAVGRYERGAARPPIEYAAFLARLVWEQEAGAKGPGLDTELLEELNAAIIPYYGRGRAIKSWADLCSLVDRWLDEGQKELLQQADDKQASVGRVERSVTEASGAPWQLRAATPDFVGREAERERLVNALQGTGSSGARARLSCIRGLGGAGKTELAYRIAEELAGDFPDGQLLLELQGSTAPVRPEEALARLVQAFEPQQALPQALADLRSMYRSVLHNRRVLIVADDARDAAQVRELLPPAGSALLITTRWRFALAGLGEANVIELGGLERDEAARLLLSICPRIDAAAPELAALCGSLPLALRIAAGRLASDRTLRVERFLARLRDERSRLAALESDDAEHSVAAVLNLSYQALEPAAQSMLAQLSVFPASFSRDAIPGVVLLEGAPAPSLDQALSQLHRGGLVELDAAGERVWLHDLVRVFAAAQLDDHEAAHERHAVTYAYLAWRLRELAQQQGMLPKALTLFDAERAHISAGVAWSIQHAGIEETDATIVSYVTGLSPLSQLRMRSDEMVSLYNKALQAARRRGLTQMELLALNNLGVLASERGDDAEAQRWFEQAQALQQGGLEDEDAALVLEHNRVRSLIGLGDYMGARSAAEILRQKYVVAGNLAGQVKALLLLGLIERRCGQPGVALQHDEEALQLARHLGHPHLTFGVLRNLANALIATSEAKIMGAELYDRAVDYATQALAIAEELGFAGGRAHALTVLGNAATLHGVPQVAVQRHKEALEAAQSAEDVVAVAAILINLGDAYRALGEGALAADAYEQGVHLFESLNDNYGLARAYWNYGSLLLRLHEYRGTELDRGEVMRAAQLWQRAVELERANNLPAAQEHADALGQIQQWLIAREQADGE